MGDNTTVSKWTESATTLPPSKRYILTHNEEGKSIIHSSPPPLYYSTPMGGLSRSFATAAVPANLSKDQDVEAYLGTEGLTSHKRPEIVIPTASGSNLLVVDLIPGGESGMHQTVSVDYSICVLGLIRMELDGGEVVELRPGDHVIQRGTMHKWYNGSKTEPARFIAVTFPCEPFEIPGTGKTLAEEWVPENGVAQADGRKP